MKHIKYLLITLVATASMAAGNAFALDEYLIDPEHSRIQFHVRYLGLSEVTGDFSLYSGRILFAKDELDKSRVDSIIETKSINTEVTKRDKHLRSPDFLDVTKFPKMSFLSSDIVGTDLKQFVIKGVLTLHGISLPVEIQTSYIGEETDPWGYHRVAFTGKTALNRKDYGLTWSKILETGSLVVADQVNITLDIQAVKKQATPPGVPQMKDDISK